MSTNLWEDFAKRNRELYQQQTELAKTWMEGQAQVANALAQAGKPEGVAEGEGSAQSEAGAMADLWRSWLSVGGSLGNLVPGMADPGKIAGETLGRFMDPMSLALVSGSQVGDTIRKLTEGPRLADLGQSERRLGKVMELWLSVQQAARAYEGVVAGAWAEAGNRFNAEFQKRHAAGEAPSQAKEALKLWLDTANRTLLETHRSESFLAAQRNLLRNGMDFLLAEREMVEMLVEPAGLPTRSEIDEVHRSVQELKRRVRTLEKAAAEQASPDKAAEQANAAAPKPDVPKKARAAASPRRPKPAARGAAS